MIHHGIPGRVTGRIILSTKLVSTVPADVGDFVEVGGELGKYSHLGILTARDYEGEWFYRSVTEGKDGTLIRNREHLKQLIDTNQHPTL